MLTSFITILLKIGSMNTSKRSDPRSLMMAAASLGVVGGYIDYLRIEMKDVNKLTYGKHMSEKKCKIEIIKKHHHKNQ